MPSSPPPSSTFEHGRRGQIRRYLQKFTTTIRRGSKDSDAENNIPQSSVETNDAQEHSHDDTLFTNTIDADQLSTTREDPEEQSRPTPPVISETFHVDRASVYQERAQKLRDRYGMNIAGSDRSTFPATARRVQKSARMRVHRSCHECGVDFGHGIHCRACHHRLCGECPRTPGEGIKEAMAQAREFPFHVVAEESSTSPDLPMTEAPAIVSDHLDVFDTMSSTGKQVSKPSTSLEPILAGNSYLPPLEVDDDVPDSAPFRIAYDFRHGKDKADISISPRSSRHVPYPISTIRDPILRAPSGVQRVYRKPRQRVRYTSLDMSFQFNAAVPGVGTRSGGPPPPPAPPPPPNIASNRTWSAPANNANSVFGSTPTNKSRTSTFKSTPPTNFGASTILSSTGIKTASAPPKTAVTATRAASTPKGQPSRKHFKQTVTIHVGTFKQPFILHKGLLCFYSDFFRAALEGSFKEANEGKVELPDVKVEVFEAFQVWLYSRSLRNIEDHEESSERQKLPSFQTLAHLWVFGDKYQIPLLQNNCIDALLAKNKEESQFDTTVVQIAYFDTMHGSPLRKLAIDICVFDMCHGPAHKSIFINANSPNWSQEALIDFASCISAAWQHKLPWGAVPSRDKCHYHVHAAGERC
ncbi:hypothetical protein KCU65_g1355, partial [Aureobasidium melanogenum]